MVGDAALDRTLVVVESQELLRGQKRGIAVALRKAKVELGKLERRAASGRMQREILETRVKKVLQREHLSDFVMAQVQESRGRVSLTWHVDAARRRLLERTRLGRQVLCTDHHNWSNDEITLRRESYAGAGADKGAGPPSDRDACAGRNSRPAQGNQDLRARPLGSSTSFIYATK